MDENSQQVLPSPNSGQALWNPMANRIIENKFMVYKSQAMSELMKMVEKVALSNAAILIQGESGTGKELIAHAIHEQSNRRAKPFVAINCGALRESLLESELFGHEKGAFTGAINRKIGLAEMANGGTLFLDEIGELTPAIQAKLLRFLQEGEMYRVGGREAIRVNIRVVSATNKDLEEQVSKGGFREDLFFRINTIMLTTPPLRLRKEDIPALVNHFLNHGPHSYLNRGRQIHDEALALLQNYNWPGNVRELQNLCERLQILCDGHMIMPGDIPTNILIPEKEVWDIEYDPALTLHSLERQYILQALNYFDGNKTQAAIALGVTIKTLYNKLHEYGDFRKFAIHNKKE